MKDPPRSWYDACAHNPSLLNYAEQQATSRTSSHSEPASAGETVRRELLDELDQSTWCADNQGWRFHIKRRARQLAQKLGNRRRNKINHVEEAQHALADTSENPEDILRQIRGLDDLPFNQKERETFRALFQVVVPKILAGTLKSKGDIADKLAEVLNLGPDMARRRLKALHDAINERDR